MSVKISFKSNGIKKTSANLVLFVDEKFNLNPIKKHISSFEFNYISDLLKTSDFKKNLFVFELHRLRYRIRLKAIQLAHSQLFLK